MDPVTAPDRVASEAPTPRLATPPLPVVTVVGFLMGTADLVPGVSGGTVALVLGVYDALLDAIRTGAAGLVELLRGRPTSAFALLRTVRWGFLLALLAGIGLAVVVLAGPLLGLLEDRPVEMSGFFAGLVAGSVVLAWRELSRATSALVVLAGVTAAVTAVLLGLRVGTLSDPSLPVLAAGGAVAICAMILPGVSGSFLLLLMGLYLPVLEAVETRDLVAVAAVGVGAAVGLGTFSTFLHRLLARARDRVLALMIGLMAGSLRVLWPWPAGEEGVGDTAISAPVAGEVPVTLALFVVGAVGVVAAAALLRREAAAAGLSG